MGINYDYKSTRGEQAMRKEAKRKARLEQRKAKRNLKPKDEEPEEVIIDDISIYEEKSEDTKNINSSETNNTQDEISPQLFSDEGTLDTSSEDNNEVLKEEEEDFEIPAFLRKQKF